MSKSKDNDEFKEQAPVKHFLSKHEYDLYHEEDDIINPIIRIKRFNIPNNGEKWKIFQNENIVMVIEGNKLNQEERNFLYSVEGINFVISQFKSGAFRTVAQLKNQIKKKLTNSK